MKFSKPFLIASLLLGSMASNVAHADILKLEQAKESFDKPYIEFAKDWMKESVVEKGFGILGAMIGMNALNLNYDDQIKRTFEYPGRDAADRAMTTFTAYCEHYTGQVVRMKDEAYCLNNDTVRAYMTWYFQTEPHDKIAFMHKDGKSAQARYNHITHLSPGDTIKTKYGTGLVVETKSGGLINFQPVNGPTRWITASDIN
ncbi:hypothetical protein [Hydromonas duriensis]|uniref:Uncharacterized protein n=1 Tax=Hydromonas duriensis TaxID=1527608 RepID=A0A4R6Y5A4_9BURK|nr:hypothetical protein [Hydromonas duriensis]TDR27778.1 hypothetical protein DFR44_1396 [Hydromonas duriensis]